MGITYSHRYTYCVKNLSMDNIFCVASILLKNKINNNLCQRTKPSIDIDCSWIVRGYGRGDDDC
jgi:hypothetical protein